MTVRHLMRAARGRRRIPAIPMLALAMAASATPASAQWRAEAAIAARATTAAAPTAATGAARAGPSAGTVLDVAAARELLRRGALRLELASRAGHEGAAGRTGGDARALMRLDWSRGGRAGLTLEGGGVIAWRSSEAGASAPIDSTFALTVEPRRDAGLPTRVRGATAGLGAWARLGPVLLSAHARATGAGSTVHRYVREHRTIVDSTDWRPRFDSLEQRWVSDSVYLGRMERTSWTDEERRRPIVMRDVALDAATTLGPFALALAGGFRDATHAAPGGGWGSARATVTVRQGLGIAAQASRLAADPLRALPARRELQLGVVLRPWGPRSQPVALPASAAPAARRFAVERHGDGRVTLVVHAPGARSVELMGDFTAWRVVALERARGDTWRVTLDVARGVHHVNLRVDGGAWTPPPGLGVGDDGFGGTFGLLVL